jgi:hypothetical protein
MADPVIEDIAEALQTTLEGITTANGYTRDVADVIRQSRFYAQSVPDFSIVLWQTRRDRTDPVEGNGQRLNWDQRFDLFCVLRPTDQSETPQDRLMNLFVADVEKCLAADRTFGSKAIDSWVESVQSIEDEEGKNIGAVITLLVQYRVQDADPTAVG